MLNYLLAHPELSFTAQETADLCEAFDMTLAELHAHDNTTANWESPELRAGLAAEIVKAWLQGVREPQQLRDHALGEAAKLAADFS